MQEVNQEKEIAEINPRDMLIFIRRNRKLILLLTVAGLFASAVYLAVKPREYLSHGQIQMAQLVNFNDSANTNTNTNSYSNVEEPLALIQRLRASSAYDTQTLLRCNFQENSEMGDYLGGMLKISPIKNITNVVDIQIRHSSPELARQCLESIIGMIALQQRQLIEERYIGHEQRLAQYRQSMQDEADPLGGVKTSGLAGFAYLSRLDKISWLRTRIDELESELFFSQKHPVKLVSAISISNKPISSGFGRVIFLGGALGFMLGLLSAVIMEWWRKEKRADEL